MRTPIALALVLLALLVGWVTGQADESAEEPGDGTTAVPRVFSSRTPPGAVGGSTGTLWAGVGLGVGGPAQPTSERSTPLDPAVARAAALAAWRDRRAQERERRLEQRRAQVVAEIHARSERLADVLDLPAGAEQRIAAILLETDGRMGAARREVLALGTGPAGRERLRSAAAEVNAWRDDGFVEAFGAELAGQILAFEDASSEHGAPGPTVAEAE